MRYVSDDQPGYSRKRNGDGFDYFDTEGKPIRDEQRILRINRLAIPPAYTDVWICPSANGHIQATGRDARRRKQYRYHERWREVRDENKYEKMLLFGEALAKDSPPREERHGASRSAPGKSAGDGRFSCSRRLLFASATKNTRARTNRLA